MKWRMIVCVAAVMLIGSPAWATRSRIHIAAESQVYREKMGGMLGRGLLNVVTSFVDVLTNIVNETKAGPPFMGTLVGLAKGLGCGAMRLGSGAVDVVTFWVPGFNGFPVSDSYEDCLAHGDEGAMSETPTTAVKGPRVVEKPVIAPEPAVAPQAAHTAKAKPKWKK